MSICALFLLVSFGSIIQPNTFTTNLDLEERRDSSPSYDLAYASYGSIPFTLPPEHRSTIAVDDNFMVAATGESSDPSIPVQQRHDTPNLHLQMVLHSLTQQALRPIIGVLLHCWRQVFL